MTLDDHLSRRCQGLQLNPFQESEPERATPPHSPRPAIPPAAPAPAPASAPPPAALPLPAAGLASAAPWRARGPPHGPVASDANSWLYVPLLHASTGGLDAAALDAWRRHPLCQPWWEEARSSLQAAGGVPLPALANALELSPLHGASAALHALLDASAHLPAGAHLHLGWVVRLLSDEEGYLTAPVQEACLQLYGGLPLAAQLDASSNQFRRIAPPVLHPPLPTPPPTAGRARGRGVRRTRRGLGRGAAPSPARLPDAPPTDTGSEHGAAPPPLPPDPPPASTGLPSLDELDIETVLKERVPIFQGVPRRLHGTVQQAFRLALHHITTNGPEALRGWKLFLLIPRLLLHHPASGRQVPPSNLDRRAALFHTGQWHQLLDEARGAASSRPRQPPPPPTPATRARRANVLAHLGELSAASAALTAAPLAPLTDATLAALRDPARRPAVAQVPMDPTIFSEPPSERLRLDAGKLLANLRRGRRGAAAGPSGTTLEHLRLLLDSDEDSRLFCTAAQQLVDAEVPPAALAGLRLGRLVALSKPNGGVRGLVMGDVFRRLVSRTLAQQFSTQFQHATMPHQFALATRAGSEALARTIRAATEMDPMLTVLSVDGVGAYDLISRHALLTGLRSHPDLQPLLPYVRQFYGQPSEYVWYDGAGQAQLVRQAEGGEQGDPLMPGLFAAAVQPALAELHNTLHPGEAVLAYLDDTYVLCAPGRAHHLFVELQAGLWRHAHITLNHAKTRLWNLAGAPPAGWPLPPAPPAPEHAVWVGDPALPEANQGLVVLGTPVGHPQFIAHHLAQTRQKHHHLFEAIPTMPSLQAAWLILLFCASPRANYLLRALPPAHTDAFAAGHDDAVLRCLRALLGLSMPDPPLLARRAALPLSHGGLGLRSAHALRASAYWASWADSLPAIRARWPAVADRLCQLLDGEARARPDCVQAAAEAAASLRSTGYATPTWAALLAGAAPSPCPETPAGDPLRGWQRAATAACDQDEFEALLTDLDLPSRALLLSQAGTHSAKAITTAPTGPDFEVDNPQFRVILQRRLRLPLGLAPSHCRCGGRLDTRGDHRAACPTSGHLRLRAGPVERALARVFREAGARVTTNVPLQRMNLDPPATDSRQIEILAQGLPLWHGAQIAADVTLVSPIGRTGLVRHSAATSPGDAILHATRRKRDVTYPEFASSRRCRLAVWGLEVGGRWGHEAIELLRSLAWARARAAPPALRRAAASAYIRRWAALIAFAAQRALAATLLELPDGGGAHLDGLPEPLHAVLADARDADPPSPSRLPPTRGA